MIWANIYLMIYSLNLLIQINPTTSRGAIEGRIAQGFW